MLAIKAPSSAIMILAESTKEAIAARIWWLHKDIPFLNWRTIDSEDATIFPPEVDALEKDTILEQIKSKFKALGIIDFSSDKHAITWITEYGYKLKALP